MLVCKLFAVIKQVAGMHGLQLACIVVNFFSAIFKKVLISALCHKAWYAFLILQKIILVI